MTAGFRDSNAPPAEAAIRGGNAGRKGSALTTALIGAGTSAARSAVEWFLDLDQYRAILDSKEVLA